MAGSAADWSRYLRWNDAVARVVYSPDQAGRPVYLDLEDEVLDAVRDLAEPEAQDPGEALVDAVRRTLQFIDGAGPVLRGHLRRIADWERTDRIEPPPVLALLATLSLAAENMRDDEQFAANNFYERLQELMCVEHQKLRWFQNAYRQTRLDGVPTSARLWGTLNGWLERLEGNRGLPTAYAPADLHRHVGLPLSQALVRATDRDRFADLFLTYGLPPQTVLHPDEMHGLINEWLTRASCPASNVIRRMWRSEAARSRISEVACQVLAGWDGGHGLNGSSPVARRIDRVRIKAQLRTFPLRRLDLSLVLAAHGGDSDEAVTVLDQNGDEVGQLECTTSASGWLTLADPDAIDAGSFLDGEIALRRVNGDVLRRRARLLVPLRADELLLGFVECERATLGDELVLLVCDELVPKLSDVLPSVARPGYEVDHDIPGLPNGWTLVRGVQVLSSAAGDALRGQRVDFNVLQPVATEQITLGGGMALPGNIRKWATARPPELRVTAPDSAHLIATLTGTRSAIDRAGIEVRTREIDGPILVWDLTDEHLPDGDYEISVSDHTGVLARPDVLRLRSADQPALVLDRVPLTHALVDGPMLALSAPPHREAPAFAVVPDPSPGGDHAGRTIANVVPGWEAARGSQSVTPTFSTRLRLPESTKGSCMLSGAHYMDVEMAVTGVATVEGVCRHCGLVKRFPTSFRRATSGRAKRATPSPPIDVTALPKVRATATVDWTLGFDALSHIGGGRVSALERIAAQMDPSPLFADAFARRLEVLGHIEVERDPHTLQPKTWEVTDPVLVGLHGGDLVLAGFRSTKLLRVLNDAAEVADAWIQVDDVDAPTRIRIEVPTEDGVKVLVDALQSATSRPVRYVPNAADVLACALPPLSAVLARLARTSAIGGKGFERWDPVTARFAAAVDAGAPGAYRITGHGRAYVYRRAEDIASMTALAGDARIVKYAAALDRALPLVGYSAADEVLYVPLGADLPGLYGRAAVLASGFPPHENLGERRLEYVGVTPQLARTLIDRLMT